jgi:hypothetical protein
MCDFSLWLIKLNWFLKWINWWWVILQDFYPDWIGLIPLHTHTHTISLSLSLSLSLCLSSTPVAILDGFTLAEDSCAQHTASTMVGSLITEYHAGLVTSNTNHVTLDRSIATSPAQTMTQRSRIMCPCHKGAPSVNWKQTVHKHSFSGSPQKLDGQRTLYFIGDACSLLLRFQK